MHGKDNSVMAGKLYIVATPIGNLEDITLRAIRILKEVDFIAAEDTRVTQKLLFHYEIKTPLTSFFKGNEGTKSSKIVSEIVSGKDAALVSDAGTPCISDPGYPLLVEAISSGVEVIPIPGASSLTCAISSCGLPTNAFTYVGFLSDKSGKRQRELSELSNLKHILVLFVSKWKIKTVLKDCIDILGDRRACMCRELTKIHEEFRRDKLSELLKRADSMTIKGEIVLVIEGCSN